MDTSNIGLNQPNISDEKVKRLQELFNERYDKDGTFMYTDKKTGKQVKAGRMIVKREQFRGTWRAIWSAEGVCIQA